MNPPKYSISKLNKLELKLKKALIEDNFGHKTLDASIRTQLIELLLSKLSISKDSVSMDEKREVLSSLLVDYMGEELDGETLTKLVRKVSGWAHNIDKGKLFKKWDMRRPVWACLKVHEVEPMLTKPRRYRAHLKSYAGPTVTMEWTQIFSGPFISFLIKSMGGLKYESYIPNEAFGLWFTAAVHWQRGKFSLSHVHVSSSQQTANRKLLKARKGRCIGGFTEGECTYCPFGVDKCRIAYHSSTFPRGTCRSILPGHSKKHKGYVSNGGYCMHCVQIGNFEVKKYKKKQEKE